MSFHAKEGDIAAVVMREHVAVYKLVQKLDDLYFLANVLDAESLIDNTLLSEAEKKIVGKFGKVVKLPVHKISHIYRNHDSYRESRNGANSARSRIIQSTGGAK